MILAEEVLRCLASGKKTTRELAVLMNRPPRHVASSCQCLAKRGLITSTVGLHKISAAGRRMLAEGYTIPCGPRKGEAVQSRNSLRQRAWRVMQMLPTWQVSDILNVIDDGTVGNAECNLYHYCNALLRARILVRLPRSGAYMVKDSRRGPDAPSYNTKTGTVTDRNSGETIPLRGADNADMA